jgi:hypothetical protein
VTTIQRADRSGNPQRKLPGTVPPDQAKNSRQTVVAVGGAELYGAELVPNPDARRGTAGWRVAQAVAGSAGTLRVVPEQDEPGIWASRFQVDEAAASRSRVFTDAIDLLQTDGSNIIGDAPSWPWFRANAWTLNSSMFGVASLRARICFGNVASGVGSPFDTPAFVVEHDAVCTASGFVFDAGWVLTSPNDYRYAAVSLEWLSAPLVPWSWQFRWVSLRRGL